MCVCECVRARARLCVYVKFNNVKRSFIDMFFFSKQMRLRGKKKRLLFKSLSQCCNQSVIYITYT